MILDEYTRECLNITLVQNITAREGIDRLADLFIERGIPEHIRSDNGPEFTARAIREWLKDLGGEDFVYRTWESLGEWLY